MHTMSRAQKYFLDLVVAQHIGTDEPAAIAKKLADDNINQDTDTKHGANVIAHYRGTIPKENQATSGLKQAILSLAKKSNFHDATLSDDALIQKIENREFITWLTLSAARAISLYEWYRQKKEHPRAGGYRKVRKFRT